MTKSNEPENIEEIEYAAEESAGEADTMAKQIEELSGKLAEAEAMIEKNAARAEEQNNVLLRLQADFDNYRKRTADQTKKIREDGAVDVLMKFIPVLDVVNQALAMITDEKVAEGVRMIYNQLNELLGSYGVTEIDALGKEFDPNLHSAMMQVSVQNPDQVGVVVEVFQKGYQMEGRILRHSVVKVGC